MEDQKEKTHESTRDNDTQRKDNNAGSEETKKKKYNLDDWDEIIALFKNEPEETIKEEIWNHISNLSMKHNLSEYRIVFIYDEDGSISPYHANKIYNALQSDKNSKNVMLFLHSEGGRVEPAYLISKTCKRLANPKFVVCIPRRAKSAATLIALGADEIHMGLMSELGPIDPQIRGYPAIALSNALDKIAELSSKFPGAGAMFSHYLCQKLELIDLGYFQRVTQSAAQYAERLLAGKTLGKEFSAQSLADHFVNYYKDHRFVIDVDEATELLGANIVKKDTREYDFANHAYQFLDVIRFFYEYVKKQDMSFVGAGADGIYTKVVKKE